MTTRELNLELLLGKSVLDSGGKPIGRIEEIRAEKQGDEWIIEEYLVGSTAILERLSAWKLGLAILKLMGARKIHGGYRIPWDKLDLTNPDRPRLHCSLSELKEINQQLESIAKPKESNQKS
ncbi:hypothetical protein ACE1CI_16020 [Aerosakkonemataceae cyanobacterium BLCC-F50]|uniref:PRC-barrel domain-containing protein n=1 Tax=Floridaenema flaviceps BLCC-F50 TaxID=3153642 RepID=A0ABV4XRR9_9CYAN